MNRQNRNTRPVAQLPPQPVVATADEFEKEILKNDEVQGQALADSLIQQANAVIDSAKAEVNQEKPSIGEHQKVVDKFSSEEFVTTEIRPYIQFLHNKITSPHGLFINEEQASLAEFSSDILTKRLCIPYTYRTRDGGEFPGFAFPKPRILIIGQTPLFMTDHEGKTIGLFDKDYYFQNSKFVSVKGKYLVFLLSDNNKPLHRIPLQLTCKGACGASFSKALKQFRDTFDQQFSFRRGEPNRRRTLEFHSLSVFCPVFEPQMVGQDPSKQSLVCMTKGFLNPSENDVYDYFVGFDEDVEGFVREAFKENVSFKELKLPSSNPPSPSVENTVRVSSPVQVSKSPFNSGRVTEEDLSDVLLDEEVPF